MDFAVAPRDNGARVPGRLPMARLMEAGDLVIIYLGHDSLSHTTLKNGEIICNKFGRYRHDDMIGKPFGSKIKSFDRENGFIYALLPSPELWNAAVNVRTQIVDEVDSSVCVGYLDMHPGCRVIESGTGSGCMSLAILRAIAPTGHLYTYEFNTIRADAAREEFKMFGLEKFVTVQCRDVCGKFEEIEKGYGFSGVEDQSIDAVFLDLPEPWLAIDSAHRVIKPGKKLCSYSPCIEQVIKTCEKLRELKFHSIYMIEVRRRPFDARNHRFENADVGRSSGDGPQVSSSVEAESVVEETEGSALDTALGKRKLQDSDIADKEDDGSEKVDVKNSEKDKGPKKIYMDFTAKKTSSMPTTDVFIARPVHTIKGHTAFLTFAVAPNLK